MLIQEMARHQFKDWKTKHVESAADEVLHNLKAKTKVKAARADSKMAKELPASSWRLPRGKINFHNTVSMQTILDSWKMMPIVSAKKKKK